MTREIQTQDHPNKAHFCGRFGARGDALKTRSLRPWEWFSLRLSGILLIVFVLAHLWVLHYVEGTDVRYATVVERLRSPIFMVLDLGLLVLALSHGLMGLVRVVLDLGILGPSGERVFRWACLGVGAVSLWFGYRIFRAFLL